MADYTNFALGALYSIEQTFKRDAKQLWERAHPFLKMLKARGNHFNKGFTQTGTKMLLPAYFDDQSNPADGVQVSAELTPMTANTDNGAFLLEYQFAHYRSNIAIRHSDQAVSASNERRQAYLSGRKKQLVASFKNVMSYDVVVPTAAPNGLNSANMMDAVLSLRYILSNANVVGGKDQALDADWQAVYNTATGPFDLSYVDQDLHTVQNLDRSEIDFWLAAENTTAKVYSAFKDSLRPGERYETNSEFARKAGIKTFAYCGADVIMDGRNTAGELIGIASDTWYASFPEEPSTSGPQRISLTDAMEQVWTLDTALGCDDVGSNIRRVGITT
jgi:hypothetical protein